MTQKILITGTSGYVASHMAKYLAQKNYTIVGLDERPSPPSMKSYLQDFLQAQICKKEAVADFIQRNQVTDVIHCAAKCLVGESVEKPDLYMNYNLEQASDLLQACIDANVRSFSLSSTAAVYGEPTQTPIPESHDRKPINPYGESKMLFEDRLFEAAKNDQIHVGVLRYFNVAGADLEAEIGEDHEVETHLVPNAILATLGKKDQFKVFGDDYPTPDGTCVRDYIHVLDLALGHELLLQKLETKTGPLVYNLGTKSGYSVKEVLDEVDRQAPQKIEREMAPRRPGDPSTLIADSTKARTELGWEPQHSDLPTIIQSALRWHQT